MLRRILNNYGPRPPQMVRRILRRLWPRSFWGWVWRGGLVFLIFNIISIEVTSQSWFCNSCHIMNSYYASWQSSTHSQVQCVQCHIAPGVANFISAKLNGAGQVVDDLLHRTSTKPSASVSDFACTRSGCHDLAEVRASARKNGQYLFDHAKHLDLEYEGIAVHCTTCHSHIQGSEHFELNTNACITCHLSRSKQPTPVYRPAVATTQPAARSDSVARHGQPDVGLPRAISSSVVSSSVVTDAAASMPTASPDATANLSAQAPPDRCVDCHLPPDQPIEYQGLRVVHAEYLSYGASCESCHRNVTAPAQKVRDDHCFACHDFGLEKLGSVRETHHIHSEGRHKVECFSCHGLIRHGPSAQLMQLDQFDCQSCHQGQHAVQQATYKSSDLPAHPQANAAAVTPMFLAHVDCTGCHVQPAPLSSNFQSGASVAVATPEACDNCHKPGLGQQMIPLWQKNTRELYGAVEKMLPTEPSSALSAEAQRLVDDARRILELVKQDGSWGVHNPRYTQKLLEQAGQKLQEAQRLQNAQRRMQPTTGGAP